MQWIDGSKYEGFWNLGRAYGYGKFTYENGNVKVTMWDSKKIKLSIVSLSASMGKFGRAARPYWSWSTSSSSVHLAPTALEWINGTAVCIRIASAPAIYSWNLVATNCSLKSPRTGIAIVVHLI
jgi:hypothetical protein